MTALAGALVAVSGLALVGAPHCMGMCGPLSYAAGPGRGLGTFLSTRILGYGLVGALAGTLVSTGAARLPEGGGRVLQLTLAGVSAVVLLVQALRTARSGLVPASQLTRPHREVSVPRAAGLGLVTAVLPCGLLAGALASAAATASTFGAATTMVTFAALTSPALGLSRLAGAVLEHHRTGRLVLALALALGSVLVVMRAAEPPDASCHTEAAR